MTVIRQKFTIESSEIDRKSLEKYIEHVDTVVGAMIEAFDKNPEMLLSTVIRKVLCDSAKRLRDEHYTISAHLCIDNLNEPINFE